MLVVGYCLFAVYSISHFISIVLSVYQIRGTYGLLQTELIIHNIILSADINKFKFQYLSKEFKSGKKTLFGTFIDNL